MRVSAAIVLAVLAVGCTDSTAPPTPTSIQTVATAPSGIAGLPLATAPTFSVKDASGNILGGVRVTVAVASGGGTLTNTPTATARTSPTSIGSWTLGTTAGVNTVTVTVGDLAPLLITVIGVAGPPASLVVTGGGSQSAPGGTPLPEPLSVQLRDQFGNGVAGSTVTFDVTAGGGTISPSSGTTDASGNAGGIVWRLGRSAIPQTAIASGGGLSATASATVATEFNVVVRFFGSPPPAEAAGAFTDAAARISGAITGDMLDVDIPTLRNNAGIDISGCGVAGIIVNEIVDDVVIYASVVPIDGPGNILASAAPCVIRSISRTAIIGVMRFDAGDIAGMISSGRLNDVVLHEMMHVVGFGTIWADRQRPGGVLITGGGTDDPRYTGSLAIAACGSAGGTRACSGGVAVEGLPSGPGTADAHWRESVFDSELMTGFVEAAGVHMPMSAITIQSLADEGYVVNLFAVDSYAVPLSASLQTPSQQLRRNLTLSLAPQWELVAAPYLEIGRDGVIRQLRLQ